jgi:hypothetical protein
MISKIKIAIDPNATQYEDLIELINHIFYDQEDKIELFLITKEASSLNRLTIPIKPENVFMYTDHSDLYDILVNNMINIYVLGDIELYNDINEDLPINLVLHNVTGTKAIHVDDKIIDKYNWKKKYMTFLDFWTMQIYNYING